MKVAELVSPLARVVRSVDARWHRAWLPHVRDVVFDARTAMDYGMMAPVHRRLLADPRVRTWLMSSERPHRVGDIFREAPREAAVVSPGEAIMSRTSSCGALGETCSP